MVCSGSGSSESESESKSKKDLGVLGLHGVFMMGVRGGKGAERGWVRPVVDG